MRVQLLAGFLLTSAIVSTASAATVTMSPPSSELQTQTQPKTQPAAQAPVQPQAQHKAQPKAQAKVQPKAQPKAQPEVQAKAQPEAQPRPRPEMQSKAQPKAPAKLQAKFQARVTCPCDCPDGYKDRRRAAARHVPYRIVRRAMRSYAEDGYYHYASAAPIQREWHGHWREAPNDAFIPGPVEQEGLRIDDGGWTGGVDHASGGVGGGGFVDGYGQVHFANGGGVENGPTYNSYNQSSQFNPSQAGPFQPRLMGGIAPPSTGTR